MKWFLEKAEKSGLIEIKKKAELETAIVEQEKKEKETSQYNGWTNYETWAVNLWLTNEPETEQKLRECESPEELKVWVTDMCNEAQEKIGNSSMFSDLLSAAMSVIDWYEIWQANQDTKEENQEC